MSSRNHLYKAITDENGDLLRYASVRVYEADGVTLFDGVIYRDDTSVETYNNPFIASPALVEFYIDGGARIRLGITVDEGQAETLTEVIDVMIDAGEIVYSDWPVFVRGPMPKRAVLGKDTSGVPVWQTLRIDHEHAGRALGTAYVGSIEPRYGQSHAYLSTTTLGTTVGGGGSRSGQDNATALGTGSIAYGAGTVALGHAAYASEQTVAPWTGGALAAGLRAVAQNAGVALGASSESWSTDGPTLALGRSSLASGDHGTALGVFAHASETDIAIGWGAGSESWGENGSIGLGADAQYGLPSATTPDMWAVLLGAHDPKANRVFPWANPKGSQSESWMAEYLPTMQFAARTIQFQRHLTTIFSGALTVAQQVTLGRADSLLGFYGATPQPRRTVGEDEPGSGITALDNLIYALRDLGLLEYRTEALVNYQSSDLEPLLRQSDCVEVWPEHHGRDAVRTPAGMQAPNFSVEKVTGQPAVAFWNSTVYQTPKPKQALLGDNLVPQAKHFLAVGQHNRDGAFGKWEALINLYQNPRPNDRDDVIFVSQSGARVCTWSAVQSQFEYAGAVYAEDNCVQTRNLYASLNRCYHVWRASHSTNWPYARMVIGGGHDLQTDHDFWQGYITEVTAMDKTWNDKAVRSMTSGLMFKYHINQDDSRLMSPALEFIKRQHDPISGTRIGFEKPYADDYTGWVCGWVTGLNKPKKYSPFVEIFEWFRHYDYCGPMAGYWANLPDLSGPNLLGLIGVPDRYKVLVTSTVCDDTSGIYTEHLLGFYFLGNVGIWSTGSCWIRRGVKRAYLIDRKDGHKVIAKSDECQRTYYDDVEVRVYTRLGDTLTHRATSKLWGDGTFSTETYYKGIKVARLIELSTGKVLATTEWYERALPRAYALENSEPGYVETNADLARTYDTALGVLALTESGNDHHLKRARLILATLARLANPDGSLNDQYKASDPVVGTGRRSVKGVIWVGLAALHYQAVTGDRRFQRFIDQIALWLFGHQSDGSFVRTPEDDTRPTDVSAAGYFFFREYADTV